MILTYFLVGCSDDALVTVEDTTTMNNVAPGERHATEQSDSPVTVEDYVSAIMSSASTISNPAHCVISDIAEIKVESGMIQAHLDSALPDGDENEISKAVDDSKSLFDRLAVNCSGLKTIKTLAEEMYGKFPDLLEMNQVELRNLLYSHARLNKQTDCEERCAATAVFHIAAVEVAWAAAMGLCVGTTIGYPACAGAATAVKYLTLTAIGIDLASCLEACKG
ncbi:MAG: hypothetical protein OXF48_07845 [Bacteroidetes bacterium]|nr:hypothetical protein [Bacteroidota bacterium]